MLLLLLLLFNNDKVFSWIVSPLWLSKVVHQPCIPRIVKLSGDNNENKSIWYFLPHFISSKYLSWGVDDLQVNKRLEELFFIPLKGNSIEEKILSCATHKELAI